LGLLIGGIDFSDFFILLKGPHAETLADAKKAGAVVLAYGDFLNTIIRFAIVAFAVFLLVRWINRLFDGAKKDTPPPPTKSEALLEEIRDLLKTNR
jgi:large conductance mechanosensitive channel